MAPTKQAQRSVPPEMDTRCTSRLMCLYTYSKPAAARGEPVDRSVRRDDRSWLSRGLNPDLRSASRKPGEVPIRVMSVASARSNSASFPGCTGEPSQSRIVASDASDETSQFHIIQPNVVK